jgi:hypothetical protein
MATPYLFDHMRRRGIFATQLLTNQQDNSLYSAPLDGANAKQPYLPWGEQYKNSPPAEQVKSMADYVIAKTRVQVRLRSNANRSGLTTSNRGIHPVLLHENEMKKRSAIINPTVSARNPVQEDHYYDIIASKRRGYGPVGQTNPRSTGSL